MGRGGKQQWDDWPTSPSSRWLWRGARKKQDSWSDRKGDGKGKAKNGATTEFPAYDRKRANGRVSEQPDGQRGGEDPAGGETSSVTSTLQAALNSTRKAEQRVHSLTNAIERRTGLWAEYERDLRAAYRKEHQRFQKDMEKLRDDMQKAVATQAGTRADLLRVFQYGLRPLEETAEADRAYDRIMAEGRAEANDLDDQAILRRAYGALGGDVNMDAGLVVPLPATANVGDVYAAPPGLVAPVSTLPHACAGVDPNLVASAAKVPKAAPQAAALPEGYAGQALRDPYLMSPSAHCASGTVPSPGQHYKGPDGSRLPVKTRPPMGPPQLGGTSLGSKLDAKRNAMAPFGLSSISHAPATPAPDIVPAGAGHVPFLTDAEIQARLNTFAVPPTAAIIEDDENEEEPPDTAV